ncbi:MAG: MATE family efflux transporter [Candidatus Endonucleobacter sp. (ex Gigantidas childressi)]|nr:MATE family efflux transporter [Candidatus Endonucleobacter sp. (ex Gigantidas childressi)]
MLSQSLMSLVDAALVGPLGEEALAAVGVGSNAMLVALALISGISLGVQAQVARRIGENKTFDCAAPVNHSILIAVCFALPLSLILCLTAPWLLKIYTSAPAIHENATTYFQIRIMTLTAAVLNLSFRGYWNGTQQPQAFLKILLISHLTNVLISYLLIYGHWGLPKLGVTGASIGTLFSMYLCTLLNIHKFQRSSSKHGLFTHWRDKASFTCLLKLAFPYSLQQTFFCIGIMLLYVIIAKLGTSEMAVTHVLMNISLFLILPGVGLGISITTLVSQCLGANFNEDALQWGNDAVLVATFILVILGLPFILAPAFCLSYFLHDPKLIDLACLPLQILCLGVILDAASLVLSHALTGAGASRSVLYVRFFFQWIVLLPICWLVGPMLGLGLPYIFAVQAIQRLLSSLTFIWLWRKRDWMNIPI